MDPEYLRDCVYYEGAFANRFDPLPGIRLAAAADCAELEPDASRLIGRKIEQCIRKLLMMWAAGDYALEAERDFYSATIQEAPALFGRDAVSVHYHCEALVYFARSSLDLAAYAFTHLLPPPLSVKREDSFNDLLKAISKKGQDYPMWALIESWRNAGWLQLVAGLDKGTSLRDQLAHKTGFPIGYDDLKISTDKRSAIVMFHTERIPLALLVEDLRVGTVKAFLAFEDMCAQRHLDLK